VVVVSVRGRLPLRCAVRSVERSQGPAPITAVELGIDQRLVDRLGCGADAVLNPSSLNGFEHLE
jgi:hypothetical protein